MQPSNDQRDDGGPYWLAAGPGRSDQPHSALPRSDDPDACERSLEAHRAWATGPDRQMAQVRGELVALRTALKNGVRDVEGLLYERGPDGGLRVRACLAGASTNGPADQADARAWAALHRIDAVVEFIDQIAPDARRGYC